jgi:hypothetical protein
MSKLLCNNTISYLPLGLVVKFDLQFVKQDLQLLYIDSLIIVYLQCNKYKNFLSFKIGRKRRKKQPTYTT